MKLLFLTTGALLAAFTSAASAQDLKELSDFAQSICGDIPEGTYTKTAIQGKVGATAGLLAKLVSGNAEVSAERKDEVYKGIPFDKLPDNIPTVAMCKSELVKVILARKK
ncbi:hypothetical protein CI1B_31310 [Bradyrhizobium ivorense]|uniref:Uncharacterized protein n=1 Tax=Bradyrhizobium ivorense TaxID=2511166 RepID=A0A508TBL1_9BRAD|nr:hypothetical protein CI1B_31310 [Bradyrhizobium ivorense]